MKKYRLLRDLPGIKAGRVFMASRQMVGSDNEKIVYIPESERFCLPMFHAAAVEDYPDYFEEIVERWKPMEGEDYYAVDDSGGVDDCYNACQKDTDKVRRFGNCFRTKEQATEASKRIKQTLMEYHRELAEKGGETC